MNNYKFLPATKTGLRFDWYASINEDFILTLVKRIIRQLQGYQSTRGVSTLESQQRAERQTNIAIKLGEATRWHALSIRAGSGAVNKERYTNCCRVFCSYTGRTFRR